MEGTMEEKFADIDIPESKIQFFKRADIVRLSSEIKAAESNNKEGIVQEGLAEAVNAKNVSFLLGYGCSSLMIGDVQDEAR